MAKKNISKLSISELKDEKDKLKAIHDTVDKEIEKKQKQDRQKHMVYTGELNDLLDIWNKRLEQFESAFEEVGQFGETSGSIILPEKIKVLQKAIDELKDILHKK